MSDTGTATYTAYGQIVQSSFRLPQFERIETASSPDVVVDQTPVDLPPDAATTPTPYYQDGEDLYVDVSSGTIRVSGGRRLSVDPATDADRDLLRWTVVGAAFNFLLHQRGYLVLHASVVDINGAAVAFLGASGEGKSTTATAFLEAGYDLLADDIAAISHTDGRPVVHAAFPALKLDRSVVEDFDVEIGSVDDTLDPRDRQFYDVTATAGEHRRPLSALYLLRDAEAVETVAISPREQVLQLVAHSYAARAFGVVDGADENVDQCSRLAAEVPVRRLRRPRTIEALERVVDAVEDDDWTR